MESRLGERDLLTTEMFNRLTLDRAYLLSLFDNYSKDQQYLPIDELQKLFNSSTGTKWEAEK